jgi:hypothetical protein
MCMQNIRGSELPEDVAQTIHMTYLQVLWLIYSFHKDLSIIGDYLIRNNIFLDKANELISR